MPSTAFAADILNAQNWYFENFSDDVLFPSAGTHNNGDDTKLCDQTASWTVDALIGLLIKNNSDTNNYGSGPSYCVITDNDATTITCTLSGGEENDWDSGDRYDFVYGVDTCGGGLDYPSIRDRTRCFSRVENTHSARDSDGKYLILGQEWEEGVASYDMGRCYSYITGDNIGDASGFSCSGRLLNYDDGTEYWLAWSQYIASDYEKQTKPIGMWQGFGIYYSGGDTCPVNSHTHIMYDGGGDGVSYGDEFSLASRPSGMSDWTDPNARSTYEGKWVDWVLQMQLYDSNESGARFTLWRNGTEVIADDDIANTETTGCTLYLNFMSYMYWSDNCGGSGLQDCGTSGDGCSPQFQEATLACDESGSEGEWTRHIVIDQVRFVRLSSGDDTFYASVAPDIPPAKTNVLIPGDFASNIAHDENLSVTSDTYADHPDFTDGQNVFTHHQTDWEFRSDANCPTGDDDEDVCDGNCIQGSYNDTTNKTTWTVLDANIDNNSTYYLCVRYGAEGGDDLDRDGDGTTAHSDSDDIYDAEWESSRFYTAPLTSSYGGTLVP
jgi:hypothetical protein